MFDLIPWKRRHEGHSGNLGERTMQPLARFRDEFDSLVERFWNDWQSLTGFSDEFGSRWAMDWTEEESAYLLRAEAPGFEPGDFDVQVSGSQLILKAEHKEEQKEGSTSSFRQTRLHRVVPLPAGADPEKIEATYRNGILELRFPKSETAKGRRIDVKGV